MIKLDRDTILAMEPGTGLTELVSRYVMDDQNFKNSHYKHYSTDISAAFEVVEKMYEQGWDFTLQRHKFMQRNRVQVFFGSLETVKSSAAPEAICKAALIACLEPNP